MISGAFSLLQLDLSANFLQEFPTDALRHLTDLKFLNISNNLITVSIIANDHLVIFVITTLLYHNLNSLRIIIIPTNDYIAPLKTNIVLTFSQEIERIHLSGLTELQVLDLSRNDIGRLGVNTFSSLSALTRLDLSLNALRTVCTTRLLRADERICHGND